MSVAVSVSCIVLEGQRESEILTVSSNLMRIVKNILYPLCTFRRADLKSFQIFSLGLGQALKNRSRQTGQLGLDMDKLNLRLKIIDHGLQRFGGGLDYLADIIEIVDHVFLRCTSFPFLVQLYFLHQDKVDQN